MGIKLANTTASALYLGNQVVSKAYLGTDVVYSTGGGSGIITEGLLYNFDAEFGDVTGMTDTVNNVFATANNQAYYSEFGGYYDNIGTSVQLSNIVAQSTDVTLLNNVTASTFDAWIRWTTLFPAALIYMERRTPTYGMVAFGFSTGIRIRVGEAGSGVGLTLPGAPVLDEWQHIVFTIANDGTANIYKNGIQEVSTVYAVDWSRMPLASDINLYLNGEDTTANQTSGDMGVARFYGRALTGTEVLQNFEAQRARFGI